MGVRNFLSIVDGADGTAPIVSLKDASFSNSFIVYDIMVLIHRGVRTLDTKAVATLQNSGKVVTRELFLPLVRYVVRQATVIQSSVGKVTFIIDGATLPSKANEVERRRQEKVVAFSTAVEYEKNGVDKAKNSYAQACNVSNNTVKHMVIDAMVEERFDLIQAPNEGDAQMAKMATEADAIFCNDTDLLVYGCDRVIVNKSKMDILSGSEYKIHETFTKKGHPLYGFTRAKLIALAMVLGCDFCDGIKHVGPAKAVPLVRDHWNEKTPFDVVSLINAAEKLVNRAEVPLDFAEQFRRGVTTFSYQRVYDEETNTIQYLQTPAPGMDLSFLQKTLGCCVDDNLLCRAVARGNYNAETMTLWDEINDDGSSEEASSSSSRAVIIERDMTSFAEAFHNLSKQERSELSNEYAVDLSKLEQDIQQKRGANPNHPDVVEWDRKEVEFRRNREQYLQIIHANNLDGVNEEEVAQWTVFVNKGMKSRHGTGISSYVLKATSDENGVPRHNEETAYLTAKDRNPIVVEKCEGDGKGRCFGRRDLCLHDETAKEEVADTSLVHRFVQCDKKYRGDSGAFLAESIATRVVYVMNGGGTGMVLNRNYFGVVRDPEGLNSHVFGISFILHYTSNLHNKTIGISANQTVEINRQITQNIQSEFQLLQVADAKVSSSRHQDLADEAFSQITVENTQEVVGRIDAIFSTMADQTIAIQTTKIERWKSFTERNKIHQLFHLIEATIPSLPSRHQDLADEAFSQITVENTQEVVGRIDAIFSTMADQTIAIQSTKSKRWETFTERNKIHPLFHLIETQRFFSRSEIIDQLAEFAQEDEAFRSAIEVLIVNNPDSDISNCEVDDIQMDDFSPTPCIRITRHCVLIYVLNKRCLGQMQNYKS